MLCEIVVEGTKSFMSDEPYKLIYMERELTNVRRYNNCGTQIGFRDNSIYCANLSLEPTCLLLIVFIDMNDTEEVEKLVSEINDFLSDNSKDRFTKVIKSDKINAIQTINIEKKGDDTNEV